LTSFADISHHQGAVNLAAYKRAGHDRIILKATEGTGFTDPTFTARWRQAGQLGLARVAYHFARARFDGADEFDHLLAVVRAAGGLGARDRLCLDVEDPDTPSRAGANARQFAARAVQRGITSGLVYTFRSYAVNHGIAPSLFPAGWRRLWLADYTVGQADTAIELGAGWTRAQVVARQYTDQAHVAGIGSLCDYNRLLREWITGSPPTEEDDVPPYRQWPEVDRQALVDDITRMLTRGERIDGVRVPHIVDASTGHIVELVNLVRLGDDPDPPTGETHPGNLQTLAAKVETLEGKLDQVLDRLPAPPEPPPVP
jgi:lysozyme